MKVRGDQQRKIQSQFPIGDVVLPQDLVSFEPRYQTVVNRLFGAWLICRTQGIAEKVLAKFQAKSIACDTLSLVSKGSLTGGFRRVGDSQLDQKCSRETAAQVLSGLEGEYSTCRTKKKVLGKELEDLKAQQQCLEEERRDLESLVQKGKIQNEALQDCGRLNSFLEFDRQQIESKIDYVRTRLVEFENQKKIIGSLSADSLKPYLMKRDVFLSRQLSLVAEEIVLMESKLSFTSKKTDALDQREKEGLERIENLEEFFLSAAENLQAEEERLNSLDQERKQCEERIRGAKEEASSERAKKKEVSGELQCLQRELDALKIEGNSLKQKIEETARFSEEAENCLDNLPDIEDRIRELTVEKELLEEKRSSRKKPKDHIVAHSLISQMEEIQRHRNQVTHMFLFFDF